VTESLRDLVQLRAVVDPVFDENCYVLRRRDTDRCLVVDPGLQVEAVLRLLERERLGCDRVLLTHGHPDHVAGVPAMRAGQGCPAAIHPADRFLLGLRVFPGLPEPGPVECDEDLSDGQEILWRELGITVLHTPGHTPGSVSFLLEPEPAGGGLLSGDTLFRMGVGRTDLPGGSMAALVVSIRERLYVLPPDTTVHPGHGPATTIGEEMRSNPFVPDRRHP
jgi:hydroxyacylglutathione hydrolase